MRELSTPPAENRQGRNSEEQQNHYNGRKLIYPPYGKALADRQRFNNKPSLVVISVGGDSWERAKNWQKHPNFSALVLTPDLKPSSLKWAINDCHCLIEWDIAAPESLIIELSKILLRSGALSVTVTPLWIDVSTPSLIFDAATQTWEITRETFKTYKPRKEILNVA